MEQSNNLGVRTRLPDPKFSEEHQEMVRVAVDHRNQCRFTESIKAWEDLKTK
jgi:hypothetical protein